MEKDKQVFAFGLVTVVVTCWHALTLLVIYKEGKGLAY